jgi:hypothetical protein
MGRRAGRRISMLLTVALLGLGAVAGGVALADEAVSRTRAATTESPPTLEASFRARTTLVGDPN